MSAKFQTFEEWLDEKLDREPWYVAHNFDELADLKRQWWEDEEHVRIRLARMGVDNPRETR